MYSLFSEVYYSVITGQVNSDAKKTQKKPQYTNINLNFIKKRQNKQSKG